MTNPPITIPVPLTGTPEATGSLTALLKAMEANGLCTVQQAVMVTTPNAQVATLISSLLTSPKPTPNGKDEKPRRNVYHDPETGEDIHAVAMAHALKKANYPKGKRFTHAGKGTVEVAFNEEEDKFFLRKVA